MQFYFKIRISRGTKIWSLFAQLYKNSTDCFGLEVLAKSAFQNRICSESQEKENKILQKANEEMGAQLQLTLDSLKSEERQGDY